MGADRTARIEWARTELTSSEMDAELGRLPPPERARLEDAQWLWMPGRLLWRDPSGALRRTRFTHGTRASVKHRDPQREHDLWSHGHGSVGSEGESAGTHRMCHLRSEGSSCLLPTATHGREARPPVRVGTLFASNRFSFVLGPQAVGIGRKRRELT
jgi:hypothetical protein